MKHALIVGAGGDIAGAISARLADDYEITSLSRRAAEANNWYETDYSEESLERIAGEIEYRFNLVLLFNGFLHDDDYQPEKSLRDLDPEQLATSFQRNVIVPALVLKHFHRHLQKRERTVLAALSARVGSIEDNRAGGWYGYRASKAALNMVIRNAAIELGRANSELIVVALHPGTTKSNLSEPFVSGNRGPKAVEPDETAERLINVMDGLTREDHGGFFDWQGERVPW